MSSPETEAAGDGTQRMLLTMVNRRGLHARAAAKFVNTVEFFQSEVEVTKDGQTVSGRSIMGLLMLAATLGSTVEVTVEGIDARPAADAIATLVNDGFGETD